MVSKYNGTRTTRRTVRTKRSTATPHKRRTSSHRTPSTRRRRTSTSRRRTATPHPAHSAAYRKRHGLYTNYEWAMYYSGNVQRHSVGVPHPYRRIAGGSTTSPFQSGTIAREAFNMVLGHRDQGGTYIAYLAVVVNKDTGAIVGYYGAKRHAGGKSYWGVKPVYHAHGKSLAGIKFSHLHGRVVASRK